jgi:translation initiation factor IF-1
MGDVERDRMEVEGVVINSNKGIFEVMSGNNKILCTLSGKIKLSNIKVLQNDKVLVEISPYDTSRGRIIFRHKSV